MTTIMIIIPHHPLCFALMPDEVMSGNRWNWI